MNQPVQLSGRRRAGTLTAMSQGLQQPMPPRVSVKAQKFTLIDSAGVQVPVNMHDPQYGLYLDVVIIGANPHKSKQYFEYAYDPTRDDPPTCFSDNGIGPSAQSATPQSPTCAACPNNVWGSDTSKMTGRATKACSDRKNLAVVVVNDPAQLVYRLQIPPATLKNLSVLARSLSAHQVADVEGVRAADPADVITRVYFDQQNQGVLLFQPMGFHQQMAPYIDTLIEKADATGVIATITNENDVPYAGAGLPAPDPVQQLALPPQMQAPPPAAPAAPRTRRGGARAGAGRPTGPAPQAAPHPGPVPFQQPNGGFPAQQPAPMAQPAAPAPGPVPFQPRPAPMAAPPAGAPSMEIPGFLDRRGPAPAPAAAPQGAPAFGMAHGTAPNPELAQALDNAFSAPLQPRPRGG